MPLAEFTWERGADNKKMIFIRDARMSFAAIDANHISPEESKRRANLFCASPSMLALLEKALPIIQAEAGRRSFAYAPDKDTDSYWREMRDLANEISAEIDRARGKGVSDG